MTDAAPKRPFANSYWVIPGRLLAGEYPAELAREPAIEKLRKVIGAGITYFLDLTSPEDPLRPYEPLLSEAGAGEKVVYSRRTIRDMGCPTSETMRGILDEIDTALDGGHNVYVHCWGGIGRTGTVVGCHFVRRGHTGDAALAEVARLYGTMSRKKTRQFPESPQTDRQRAFVRGWAEPSRVNGTE
jgi:hypothetical protein